MNIWAVGSTFGGKEDVSGKFFKDGIWYDGYAKDGDDRYKEILTKITVGDILVMKSSATKGVGHKTSFTKVKAVGWVREKVTHFKFLVDWFKSGELPMDFDGIWYSQTIEPIREDAIKAYVIKLTIMEEQKKIQDILLYKKQIILQGPPGTGKTYLAKEIAKTFVPKNGFSPNHIEKLIYPGLIIQSSTNYTQYKVLSVSPNGVQVQLKNEETDYLIPIKHIQRAYEIKLWEGGQKNGSDPYAAAIAKYIYNNQPSGQQNTKLIQFHPAYTYEDFVRGIVVKTHEGSHPEYKVVDKVLAEFARKALENKSSNYVLIIDEINRANLPSVLGELIYALEYRFDPEKPEETSVESMYSLRDDDDSESSEGRLLRLPQNLLIIGTMNTADRSVGHIDYAIRRRFAFVDVLPSIEPIKNESAKEYFKLVSELFVSNYEDVMFAKATPKRSACLASDFGPEQVWIGHSYFITEKEGGQGDAEIRIKMKYEVLPLIKEYVKDGILNSDEKNADDPVQTVINRLQE